MHTIVHDVSAEIVVTREKQRNRVPFVAGTIDVPAACKGYLCLVIFCQFYATRDADSVFFCPEIPHCSRTLQGRLRYKGSSYLLRICLFQPSQSCSSTLSNLIQPHRLTSAFTMVSAVFTLPSSSSDAPHDFEHNPGNSTGSSCVIARDQPVNGEHNPGNSTGSSCVIAREQPVNEEHNPGNSTGSSCVIA